MGRKAHPARGQGMSKVASALRKLASGSTEEWVRMGGERLRIVAANSDENWWPERNGEYLVSARHGYFVAELGEKDAGWMNPINTSLVSGGPTDGGWKRITGFKIHASVAERHPC